MQSVLAVLRPDNRVMLTRSAKDGAHHHFCLLQMDLTFSTFSLYLALTSSGEMFFITPTTGRIYCVLPVSVREEVRGHGQTPVRRAVPDKRCFVLATSDADFKRFLRAAELELLSTSARSSTGSTHMRIRIWGVIWIMGARTAG